MTHIFDNRNGGRPSEACADSFCDKAARESARMGESIKERLRAADQEKVPAGTPVLGLDALTSGAPRDPLSYAMRGASPNVAQQARAPGKMFSRSDILAVLRGLAAELTAQGIHSAGLLALDRARTIFEHLE